MSYVKHYLLIYNLISLSGWSAIMTLMMIHLTFLRTFENLFFIIETLLRLFQTTAVLEVFHAQLGFVRSNPLYVSLQIISRLFIVWITFCYPDQVTNDCATFFMLMAWTITEIIRYSYYSWLQFNKATIPHWLVWLRYSTFIILYPIGVTGEILTTASAMDYLRKWKLFGVPWKSETIYFDMSHLVLLLAIPYISGFALLYIYMLGQRKKVLGIDRTIQSPKKKK